MRIKLYALLLGFILAIPNYTAAGWEVASPGPVGPTIPREPFFQSKIQPVYSPMRPRPFRGIEGPPRGPLSHALSSSPSLAQKPKGIYAVSISGSLKENLERIMSRYHWRVVWKAPYDYNFDGRIIGRSLPNVIEKLLEPFPLHAVMYMSNRTLAVTSRPRYK